MDKFVARENIRHFREKLWIENDPDMRVRLRTLLVAEEDKLAADIELLADIDRHIADGHARIVRQLALVAELQQNGHNGTGEAERLLDAMRDSQDLHNDYRRRVLTKIEQNRL
jgi:hypothetical protein